MLEDWINHKYPREYNIKSEITENRATTDESIKLLNEMHEKTLENILGNITFKDNNFFGKLHVYRRFISDQIIYHLQFSLNGNKHNIKIPVDRYKNLTDEQTLDYITDTLANYLSRTMLKHLFENITREERDLLTNETYNNRKA